jgi:hypothetical protein
MVGSRSKERKVSSTSGKDDGSLAGDGWAMGWAVGALGHVHQPPVTEAHLLLALDW